MNKLSLFQQYVYKSRYSKFMYELNRRENWDETVKRYFDFMTEHLEERCDYKLPNDLRIKLENSVLNFEVMPSMRGIMTAGIALKKDEAAIFNCSYTTIDNPKAFGEIMYLLMCGVGAGFSCERQYVNKLPTIPDELHNSDTIISVADTRIGWAKSINELISILYAGSIPKYDVSKVRPAGAVLKSFGGRASGPDPLIKAFNFIINTFKEAIGRKLTSIECHDVICKIADVVIAGGARRSALISLSNLSDDRMRYAKSGQWWNITPWRALANNSAVYNDKQPPMDTFMTEWKSLYDSKSGERGIFSRYAAKNMVNRMNDFRKANFEKSRLRNSDIDFGTNPCSEIILRDKEMCNLSEVVVRSDDTLETLIEKVKIATILGTFQSTITNVRFLSKKWKDNLDDERLLGVSLTGIMDNIIMSGQSNKEKLIDVLTKLKKTAIQTNIEYAEILNIPQSAAITCMKPSGTVSSLVDSASGIHTRHSNFYIRTVRSDMKDPLSQVMIDCGIYYEPDQTKPDNMWVFYFPIKSPKNSVTREQLTAIQQLEIWLLYQMYWCEHKPSVTISVKDNEWMEVGAWVYKNFEFMSGVSFLPYSDHNYTQAPYQEITEDEYNKWVEKTPKTINWELLQIYEQTDQTLGTQTLACVAGSCDI